MRKSNQGDPFAIAALNIYIYIYKVPTAGDQERPHTLRGEKVIKIRRKLKSPR